MNLGENKIIKKKIIKKKINYIFNLIKKNLINIYIFQ